jgi:deoxycytidine triphosphate deaminase
VFSPIGAREIDPKDFDKNVLVTVDLTPINPSAVHESKFILIPPHSFVLAETVETFSIPRDVLCICLGKSTYARCGLIVNVTPLEPEWKGKVTVEISNTTPLPARVYCGEGIMQCLFLRTDGVGEALLNTLRRLVSPGVLYPASGKERESTADKLRFIEEMLHKELGLATCRTSYADKKGIYNNQTGIVPPSVRSDKSV